MVVKTGISMNIIVMDANECDSSVIAYQFFSGFNQTRGQLFFAKRRNEKNAIKGCEF